MSIIHDDSPLGTCEKCEGEDATRIIEMIVTDEVRSRGPAQLGLDEIEHVCQSCASELVDSGQYCYVDTEEEVTVTLIASGYDFECPKCGTLGHVDGDCGQVTCIECGSTWKTNGKVHPTG